MEGNFLLFVLFVLLSIVAHCLLIVSEKFSDGFKHITGIDSTYAISNLSGAAQMYCRFDRDSNVSFNRVYLLTPLSHPRPSPRCRILGSVPWSSSSSSVPSSLASAPCTA